MGEYSKEWADCLREMLRGTGCPTGWQAEKYTNGALSHGYIVQLLNGLVPRYGEKLVGFLSFFPRHKAIACLKAAGLPVPPEWTERADQQDDPVTAVEQALRATGVPSEVIDRTVEFVRDALGEEDRGREPEGAKRASNE